MDSQKVIQYFNHVVSGARNPKEQAFLILSARGFLLEWEDDQIIISDNSSEGDIRDLNNFLIKQKIGSIDGNKIMMLPSFSVNVGVNMFEETEKICIECITWNRQWRYFKNRIYGSKINVLELEPYIARYIKAISAIGIDTSMSCDGNHKKRYSEKNDPLYIAFNSKYDLIWLRIVSESVLNLAVSWTYEYASNKVYMEYTDETQVKFYSDLLEAANCIYDKRIYLRELKHITTKCAHAKNKKIEYLSQDDVYELLLECLNNVRE